MGGLGGRVSKVGDRGWLREKGFREGEVRGVVGVGLLQHNCFILLFIPCERVSCVFFCQLIKGQPFSLNGFF